MKVVGLTRAAHQYSFKIIRRDILINIIAAQTFHHEIEYLNNEIRPGELILEERVVIISYSFFQASFQIKFKFTFDHDA